MIQNLLMYAVMFGSSYRYQLTERDQTYAFLQECSICVFNHLCSGDVILLHHKAICISSCLYGIYTF